MPAAIGARTFPMVWVRTSNRMVTGHNGSVLAQHDFRPFGEEVSGAPLAHDGFGGKERDAEKETSGAMALNYFGARHLHAAGGRFTGVDPIVNVEASLTNPQRWNRYSYFMAS